jgi:hypothetical protein
MAIDAIQILRLHFFRKAARYTPNLLGRVSGGSRFFLEIAA